MITRYAAVDFGEMGSPNIYINDLARFCFPAPKLSEDQQTYFRFDVTWTVHTQEYKNQQILIAL